MQQDKIKEITDFYLRKFESTGLNSWSAPIEPEMGDKDQDPQEEWLIWHAIDSQVTGEELEGLEERIGHQLPADYKVFLQHKHFYELNISQAGFCRHPVNIWKDWLLKNIFDGWPTEYHIDKGLIPFADWSDWGMLCFDTNRDDGNHNYPIVLWDHEIPDQAQDFSPNFYALMVKLDEEDRRDSR